MSKKTHQKQLDRARAKREAERVAQRSGRNRVMAIVLVLVLAGAVLAGAVLSRQEDTPEVAPSPTSTVGAPLADPCDLTGVEQPTADTELTFTEQPERPINEDATYLVTLATTCGEIVLELDPALGANTVANFLGLAEAGYYDGVPFHRVIEGFMIQGGDPTGAGSGDPGYTIPDELEQTEVIVAGEGGYPRGAIAMARPANADGSFLPDSAGAQFFIVQGQGADGAPFPLPPQYAIFGRAVDGLDILDRIAAGPAAGPRNDLAVNPVRITSIRIDEVPAGEQPGDASEQPTGDASEQASEPPSPSPTS